MSASAVELASLTASLERHRPALTGHCSRMLGSVVDAEDAVQEAMLRMKKLDIAALRRAHAEAA